MGLDIRWPIGLMFSLIGVIMVVYGLVTGSGAEIYQRSLGMNVNLYWGLLLVVFGGAMLTAAWRGSQAQSGTEDRTGGQKPDSPSSSRK
jgi:hypothetical protein